MKAFVLLSLALLAATARAGFDPSSKKNFVIYWGQANGLGEKDLSEYCKNDDYNIIVVHQTSTKKKKRIFFTPLKILTIRHLHILFIYLGLVHL